MKTLYLCNIKKVENENKKHFIFVIDKRFYYLCNIKKVENEKHFIALFIFLKL
jgi:transposase